jgi:hypothetical protein
MGKFSSSLLISSVFLIAGFISCNLKDDTNKNSGSNVQMVSKPTAHLLKKTYYPSGKIEAAIAYSADGLKDSISTFYNQSGSVDSIITYEKGKLNGNSSTYYDDRTEVKLYEEDSFVNFSIYDPQNVLEYRMPLDTSLIKKATFRFLSGRSYFDKSKTDTMLLVTNGVPMANRVLSINGATMSFINDTMYTIRSTDKYRSDSIIINIGIGYNYDTDYMATKDMLYQSVRVLKK